MRTEQERNVDAVIIGGGPCGLALATGLLQQGKLSVLVIEKEAPTSLEKQDWSRAYSYRIDSRGIRLMKRIGLDAKLMNLGVRSEGFKGVKWLPDGKIERVAPMTLGSVGYWVQRPQLISMLRDEGPLSAEHKLQGTVEKIEYSDDCASVHVTTDPEGNKKLTVKATYVFGCDGIHSLVRSSLCDQIDGDFELHKVQSISAGLVYRATLFTPQPEFNTDDAYRIIGKSGKSFSLLPYCGPRGEARPMGCVNFPDYEFYQPKTAEELYQALDEEFPQIEARKRISTEAATAWCQSEGSVFPIPRYSGKAATVVNGKTVVILVGDALHCFPPDLGQGVNAGMVDVYAVLDVMEALPQDDTQSHTAGLETKIAALNDELVKEAKSVCELIPLGFPYQYTLPHSIHKVCFYMDFLTRIVLHKCSSKIESWTGGLIPKLFTAPVIFEIQDDPPLKYSTILQHHYKNSMSMMTAAATTIAVALGAGWYYGI